MQNTPVAGLPWPELSDIPNAQTAFQNLALALDTKVVPRFASSSARSTAITSPVAGMITFQQDTVRFEYYDGSAWRVMKADSRQKINLTSAAASVTFNNIPSTAQRVKVTWTARSDAASTAVDILMRVNGNSSTQYSFQWGKFSGTSSSANTGVTNTSALVATIFGANAGANRFCNGWMEWSGWDDPHTGTAAAVSGGGGFDVAATNSFISMASHLITIAGPYNSLTFLPAAGNFAAGSEFTLIAMEH